MKKLLAMIFAVLLVISITFSMTACTKFNATDLMSGISARSLDVLPDMDAGGAAAADFGVRLFRASMDADKNSLISPLSVLYALAMTANGADGETLAQMEEVLGMDSEDLNCYMHAYMDLLADDSAAKLRLANSIWFKDDPNLTVVPGFLQTNADYYGADIYQAAFNNSTVSDVNKWVKKHTDEMIPEILDTIPDDAVMYLVNALAFEAPWDEAYTEYQVLDGTFTKEDGTVQDVQIMYSKEKQFLEDEKATGFIKYYEGRNYAFAALLPNEGVTVSEYVNGLTGQHLQEMLSDAEEIKVFAYIPKFEIEYEAEMSEVLKEMGMTDAFDWTVADFSRLGSYNVDGSNICIGRVVHKTFISVAEQGTKAGAETEVVLVSLSAEREEYRRVRLDRPFVYMLIDCETNLPLFIGTVMDVNGD